MTHTLYQSHDPLPLSTLSQPHQLLYENKWRVLEDLNKGKFDLWLSLSRAGNGWRGTGAGIVVGEE